LAGQNPAYKSSLPRPFCNDRLLMVQFGISLGSAGFSY